MRIGWIAALAALFTVGCSQFTQVRVEQVESTNYVKMRLKSGENVEGTVVKADPYLLAVLQNDRQTALVQKSAVQHVRRMPPVADDFGKGITEEEIQKARSHRNTAIYGIGGGALSFGFSFFAGSLAGHASANGGAVLAGTALSGTTVGTVLFIRAGAAKDRREAVEAVRAKRRNVESAPDEGKTRDNILLRLEEEKKKNDEFQRQREQLLRDLEETQKNDSPK
jgi:small nuclear ribonucleoprotein (snRNP)-like protein